MDGRKADSGKAMETQPAATEAGEGPAKPLDDAAPAAADEEVDDEQVERFYALLANLRAMRGVYVPGGGETAGGNNGSGATKRLRSAEPPWKPAFRLEDFEADATAATSRCAKKEKIQADGEEGDDPVAPSPSMSQPPLPRTGARRFGSNSKSI